MIDFGIKNKTRRLTNGTSEIIKNVKCALNGGLLFNDHAINGDDINGAINLNKATKLWLNPFNVPNTSGLTLFATIAMTDEKQNWFDVFDNNV